MHLRDFMLACPTGLMSAYTAGMNLLGCEGCYGQDYCTPYTEADKEAMKAEMLKIGEVLA